MACSWAADKEAANLPQTISRWLLPRPERNLKQLQSPSLHYQDSCVFAMVFVFLYFYVFVFQPKTALLLCLLTTQKTITLLSLRQHCRPPIREKTNKNPKNSDCEMSWLVYSVCVCVCIKMKIDQGRGGGCGTKVTD